MSTRRCDMKLLKEGGGQYSKEGVHRPQRRRETVEGFEHSVSHVSTFSHQVMTFMEDAEKLLLAVLNQPDEPSPKVHQDMASSLARYRRPRFQGRRV
jgi:hypothetical protein